jgi:hypothetical protein
MSRFDKLIPHFNTVLTSYPDLQKNDLLMLVKTNIEEWKDKPSMELIEQISNLKDEHFMIVMNKIGVTSKPTIVFSIASKSEEVPIVLNWNCSVCTYTMTSKATECEMCGIPRNFETSMVASAAAGGGGGGGAGVSRGKEEATFAPPPPPPPPTTNDTDDWFVNTNKKKKPIVEAYSGAGGGGGGATFDATSIDSSDAKSEISMSASYTSSSIMTSKFQHTPITHKLYMKGWTEINSPFHNGTENDLIEHFNNAMCRARETGLIQYVIGIEPLSKPTSLLIVFSNSSVATAAMHLDMKVYWKNAYLHVKRPQGYYDENDNVIAPLKMNVIIEKPNVKLPPIIGFTERKQIEQVKMYKKLDKIREATNASINFPSVSKAGGAAASGGGGGAAGLPPLAPKKKVVAIVPTLSAEQKILVDSIDSKLRKPSRECLNILCAHDGRETSVNSDALYELCTILQDHGILTATKKGNKLVIKDNIASSKSFCIDMNNHAQGHVMLHSIADVRNILREANFPEFAFA